MSNLYDEVLYVGHPFVQTHPDRLATIGRLFGMQPAPLDRCRVLELGCADGGNLIPMAYTLPSSEFVGTDLALRGIEIGREKAAALGLKNLDLRQLDILETDTGLGKFDYIIAHGVFSWVPRIVQDRLLEVCAEALNPQGIAYISYAAYPGAHGKKMIAEMMKYHALRFDEPEKQIEQARAFLLFLARSHPRGDAYSALLEHEIESVSARHPRTVFHDELSSVFEPCYFRDFVERAGKCSLQYLGEANFFEMSNSSEPQEIRDTLSGLARDQVDIEQYLDFLRCRRFRQTLLCRSDAVLNRRINASSVREFRVRLVNFQKPEQLPTQHPLAMAVVEALRDAWPRKYTFQELLADARGRAGSFEDDESLLADILLACFAGGIIQLYVHPPHFTAVAGDLPRASAVARAQAQEGPQLTNLNHELVTVDDDAGRRLVGLMDGTRTRAALLQEMRAADPEAQAEKLEAAIAQLAHMALLEA